MTKLAKEAFGKNESILFEHPESSDTRNNLMSTGKSRQSEAKIYCDGASSGNPGHSGIGAVIRLNERPDTGYTISEYIGIATNNIAEYKAFVAGIEKARSLGLKRVDIFLDSELLVKQINRTYKVRSAHLRPFWEKAQHILKQFESYIITHIRRDLNREADSLARRAIKDFIKN